jgi:hypothetical protein
LAGTRCEREIEFAAGNAKAMFQICLKLTRGQWQDFLSQSCPLFQA